MTRAYLRRQGIDPPANEDVVERVVRRAGNFSIDELAEWLETDDTVESKLPKRMMVRATTLPT